MTVRMDPGGRCFRKHILGAEEDSEVRIPLRPYYAGIV